MQFISQTNKREVEIAMQENEQIKKANEEYEYLTGEEAERRLAFLVDKAKKDESNMIEGARQEGIEQGIEQGKKEGIEQGKKEGIEQGKQEGRKQGIEEGLKKAQIEMAKKLLKKEMLVEEIEEITKLTKEEIEKLK